MHIAPTVYVRIGEGFELIQAIRKIEAGVKKTLASFKSEFE